MNFSIITPVTRVNNLKAIGLSIEQAIEYYFNNTNKHINVTWYTIFDASPKFKNAQQDFNTWELLKKDFSFNIINEKICYDSNIRNFGGLQRTFAHNLIKDSWVCAIDDDNIMHKKYLVYADSLINTHSYSKAILLERGKYPQIQPKKVIKSLVDTADILYKINQTDNLIWPKEHSGDYEFINMLHIKHNENFIFIVHKGYKPIYYNFLREYNKLNTFDEPYLKVLNNNKNII